MERYEDTTFTEIYVGGLGLETQRHTLERYFEQFGEIVETKQITRRLNYGTPCNYGFVTFKDPEAAMRACRDPFPVIDGVRTTCNPARGSNNSRPSSTFHHGAGIVRPPPTMAARASSSSFIRQPAAQYTFPISAYGCPGYFQSSSHPMNYYNYHNAYGGQNFPPFYPPMGVSGPGGVAAPNFLPIYDQTHGDRLDQYQHRYSFGYSPVNPSSSSSSSSTSMAAPTAGEAPVTEPPAWPSTVPTRSRQNS